jgi:hypothetical protein
MPDETPSMPVGPPAPSTPAEPKPLPHLGEEFDTANKNLPPAKIVLIGVAAVVLVAMIWAVVQRPQSSATGSIDDVSSVEIPNQNSMMVALNVSIHNHGQKPFWIKSIEVDLDTGSNNKLTDDAASAVDFDRYFQAFPVLKEHALPALKPETMLEPNADAKGTIIVSFPVTPDALANRKSLTVTIRPYDQPKALVITK